MEAGITLYLSELLFHAELAMQLFWIILLLTLYSTTWADFQCVQTLTIHLDQFSGGQVTSNISPSSGGLVRWSKLGLECDSSQVY